MSHYVSRPISPRRASLERPCLICQCLNNQCPITGGQWWKSILIHEADKPKCCGIYHFCLHALCVKEFLIFYNSNILAWFLLRDIKSSCTSSTFEARGFFLPSHWSPAQRPGVSIPGQQMQLLLSHSLAPNHPSSRCSGHAPSLPWWLAAETPTQTESRSWPHVHSCLPRWLGAHHP